MPRRDDMIFGVPGWIDLSTSDIARAKTFYGELFGWTFADSGADFGHYHTASLGDAAVAGLSPKMMEGSEQIPDAWMTYFGVEDARKTIDTATKAGGTSHMDAMQVGNAGTMGVLTDPTGADLGLWQPDDHRGIGVVAEPGAPAWFELMTLDFPAAIAFYQAVFNADFEEADTGEGGPDYRTFNVDGEAHAGVMDANGIMPEEVPSNWLVYFNIADTDAAIGKATELGGSVLAPAADTPFGRFALLGDPTGVPFAIIS